MLLVLWIARYLNVHLESLYIFYVVSGVLIEICAGYMWLSNCHPGSLFYLWVMALRCALGLLKDDSDDDFFYHNKKESKLWATICTATIGLTSRDSRTYIIIRSKSTRRQLWTRVPDWVFDFMPGHGGYFIGNVSPARMDFRWYCLGNFISVVLSLATGWRSAGKNSLGRCHWRSATLQWKVDMANSHWIWMWPKELQVELQQQWVMSRPVSTSETWHIALH